MLSLPAHPFPQETHYILKKLLGAFLEVYDAYVWDSKCIEKLHLTHEKCEEYLCEMGNNIW